MDRNASFTITIRSLLLASIFATASVAQQPGCSDFAFYFGPAATNQAHDIGDGTELVISSRNVTELLGFQLGVKGHFSFGQEGVASWEFSSELGAAPDNLIKVLMTDSQGVNRTPQLGNQARSMKVVVSEIRPGKALLPLGNPPDYFSVDRGPTYPGVLGFTVGCILDLQGQATIPATPQVAPCPLNELLVVKLETLSGKSFHRCDCNSSNMGRMAVDIADVAAILSLAVGQGPDRFQPTCIDACDCDDSGTVDIADAIFALRYLFQFDSLPPFPGPGLYWTGQPNPNGVTEAPPSGDPTADGLDCQSVDGPDPGLIEICGNQIDDDGNGLVDDDDPACQLAFACGSRELGPSGLPLNRVFGSIGSTVDVSFYIRSPEGSQPGPAGSGRIQGFSMSLTFCCDLAMPEVFDVSGTVLETAGAEFVSIQGDNDPNDGDGCELILSVLVDALSPFQGTALPALKHFTRVGSVPFIIRDEPRLRGQCCDIRFTDGVNGRGLVPIRNLVSVGYRSISPRLLGCSVCFTEGEEFYRGDCNGSGVGPVPVEIGDLAALASYIFDSGESRFQPTCLDACDANDDGVVNPADFSSLWEYLLRRDPRFTPPSPAPGFDPSGKSFPPGPDPTEDALACDVDASPQRPPFEDCGDGTDNDLDGATDDADADCRWTYALSIDPLGPGGLEDINLRLGESRDVYVFLNGPAGSPLESYLVSFSPPCDLVFNPGFEVPQDLFLSAGVYCSVTHYLFWVRGEPPPDPFRLPSDAYLRLARLTVTIPDNPDLIGTTLPIKLADVMEPESGPPIINVLSSNNRAIHPRLENSEIRIHITKPDRLRIGGFTKARGGEGASFADGAAFTRAREALGTARPNASFESTDTLNWEFLRRMEVFILPVISNDADGILPLTRDEEEALLHFVEGGGALLLLGDNAVVAGITGDQTLAGFGMRGGGRIPGDGIAQFTDRVHPLAQAGASFPQRDAGWFSRLGNAKELARNSGGTALAVIEAGQLSPISGPVIAFSDVNTFWDTSLVGHEGFFDQTRQLFLDAIDYLVRHEPQIPPAPEVYSADSVDSPEGPQIAVYGAGFGLEKGGVILDREEGVVVAWARGRVILKRPASRTTGTIEIRTASGAESVPFEYSFPARLLPLKVEAAASKLQALKGEVLVFTGKATTDPACYVEEYLWRFDDDTTLYRGEQVAHAFQVAGSHRVEFLAADQCPDETTFRGRTALTSLVIQVAEPPLLLKVTHEPQDPTLCDTVTFTGQVSNQDIGDPGLVFCWDLGDGTRLCPSDQVVTHKYAEPGLYDVYFVFCENQGGGCTGSPTVQVGVRENDDPVPEIAVLNDSLLVVGSPVRFLGSYADRCNPGGGPYACRWDFGDGGTSASCTDASHAYATCGEYTVILTVTDGAGASGAAAKKISVDAPPVAALADPGAAREGEQITFDASASRDPCFGIAQYAWEFGDGDSVTLGDDEPATPYVRHAYGNNGAYTVRLHVRDTAGLSDTTSRNVVIANAPPSVSDISLDRPCAGELLTFTAAGFDLSPVDRAALDYQWTFRCGADVLNLRGNPVRNTFPPCDLEVTVEAVDSAGARSETRTERFTIVDCLVTAVADCPLSLDEGEKGLFSAADSSASAGEVVGFEWDFGDGERATGPVARHAFCQEGNHLVTLHARDAFGHVGDALCQVSVRNVPPVADAGDDRTSCLGRSITMVGSGDDPGCDELKYTWILPGGGKMDGPSLVYSCESAGSAELTLEVSDGTVTARDTVMVTCLPAAEASCIPPDAACAMASPAPLFEGQEVSFSGRGTIPGGGALVAYRWYFGNGTTTDWLAVKDGELAAKHTYRDDGLYRATLSVRNVFFLEDSCSVDVTIENAPPKVNAGPDRQVMAGVELELLGLSSDPGVDDKHTFLWDFGDGNTATTLSARHVYSREGSYTATLTVWDDDGGVGSDSAAVDVGPRPPFVSLHPGLAVLPTCVGATSIEVRVTNLTASPDTIEITIEGLPRQWLELGANSVELAPGGAVGIALLVTPGACAGIAGAYRYQVSARSQRTGLVRRASGVLEIVDSPIILQSTVTPADEALVSATQIAFTWRTVAPSDASLHYRRQGEELFTVLEGGAEDETLHFFTVAGFEEGHAYEWYGVSTCCNGEAVADTGLRTFRVLKGVSIEVAPYACVPRRFDACVELLLTNDDPVEHRVSLAVRSAPEELRSFKLSPDELTVPAGETRRPTLCMDSRAALPSEGYAVLVEASVSHRTIATQAWVTIETCDPVINFTFAEVERNQFELVNTFRLVNLGDPLTAVENGEVVVERGEGFGPDELIFLDGNRFALGAGESTTFRVQYAGPEGQDRSGKLVAAAAKAKREVFTDFGCPGGASVFRLDVADTALCRRVVHWYSDDMKEGLQLIPFELPEGFALEDMTAAEAPPVVFIRFELPFDREVYPNHTLAVELNGRPIGPELRNIVPVGAYAFAADPADFRLPTPGAGLAQNEITLRVTAPKSRPFLERVDVRLNVPLRRFKATICATSQEDAEARLKDLVTLGPCDTSDLDLSPRITGVAIIDEATGAPVDSFCTAERRHAEVRVDAYNPAPLARNVTLEYAIAELPFVPGGAFTSMAFPGRALQPFEAVFYQWNWDIPRTTAAAEYGILLELREAVTRTCFDCRRSDEWTVKSELSDFEVTHLPDELFLKQGAESSFKIDVRSICGFDEGVRLRVSDSPPLFGALLQNEVVPAGGTTRLNVQTSLETITGRQYVILEAVSGSLRKVVSLPVSVTRTIGSDLVIKELRAESSGDFPGKIVAGDTVRFEADIANAGDLVYLGARERIRVVEYDGAGRFIQSDLSELEIPPLAPGEVYSIVDEQVFPLPELGHRVRYDILKEFPSLHYDNDIRNNSKTVVLDIEINPIPYLSCALSLLWLVHSSSWTGATIAGLEEAQEVFAPFSRLLTAREILDAIKRKDDVQLAKSAVSGAVDIGQEVLEQLPEETVTSLLTNILAVAGAVVECWDPAVEFSQTFIASLGAVLDLALHRLLPAYVENRTNAFAVLTVGPVDLAVDCDQGPHAVVKNDGDLDCGPQGTAFCSALQGGKIASVLCQPRPRIIVTGVAEGEVQIAVQYTDFASAASIGVLFPVVDVQAAVKLEVLLDGPLTGGRLLVDANGDGFADETLLPETVHARRLNAPVLLTGALGTRGVTNAVGDLLPTFDALPLKKDPQELELGEAPKDPDLRIAERLGGRPFSQTLFAARYIEGPSRFDLLAGPPGMQVEPGSGWLSWSPARQDVGFHDVKIAVTDSLGLSDVETYRLEVRPARLIAVEVIPNEVSSTEVGTYRRLRVTGLHADGTTSDLTEESTGTTYESDNDDVATVLPGGLLEIKSGGEATVFVRNSGFSDVVRIHLGFRRGDADTDGALRITDAIFTLLFLFLDGAAPRCPDAADTNDTGGLNLTDPIYLLNYLYIGGPAPPFPGAGACGIDPTYDRLRACTYEGC